MGWPRRASAWAERTTLRHPAEAPRQGKLEDGRKSRAHVLWSRMAMLYSDDLAAQDQPVSGRAPSDMDLDSAPAKVVIRRTTFWPFINPDLSRWSNWTAAGSGRAKVRAHSARSIARRSVYCHGPSLSAGDREETGFLLPKAGKILITGRMDGCFSFDEP
ncbi:hypothetical protein VTN02DRAFT_3696 [Thermoascus thermophilus]